jgi:hypothetical protein
MAFLPLSALGPQLSFVSVINPADGSWELISAKAYAASLPLQEAAYNQASYSRPRLEDAANAIIHETVVNFGHRFRTGESTVAALLQLVRDELLSGARSQDLSLLSGVHINQAVDVITEVCFRCADSLALNFAPSDSDVLKAGQPSPLRSTSRSTESDKSDSDVDWFFDQEEPSDFGSAPKTGDPVNSYSDSSHSTPFDEFTDEWIACGLQHCWEHDYVRVREDRVGLALPMRLARKTCRPTADSRHVSKANSSYRIRDRNYGSHVDGDSFILGSLTSHGLLVVQLTGQQSRYSDGVFNGLYVPMSVSDYDNLIRSVRKWQKHDSRQAVQCVFDTDSEAEDEERKESKVNKTAGSNGRDSPIVLGRLAIIDSSHLHEGEYGEGVGISETARSVQTQVVIEGSDYPTNSLNGLFSEENEKFQLYILKCLQVLKGLHVQLLICGDCNLDRRIVDALRAHSVAVCCVHSVHVEAFARLLDIWPVWDILDLTAGGVSGFTNEIHITEVCSFSSQRSRVLYRRNLDALPLNYAEKMEFNFHNACGASTCAGTGDSVLNTSNCVMLRMQVVSKCFTDQRHRRMSSILVVAPSTHLADAIEDRVARCIYRLHAVGYGPVDSGVPQETAVLCRMLPGAGVYECVACAQLDHLRYLLLRRQNWMRNSLHLTDQETDGSAALHQSGIVDLLRLPVEDEMIGFDAALLFMIDVFRQVFRKYIMIIAENNGVNGDLMADRMSAIGRHMQARRLHNRTHGNSVPNHLACDHNLAPCLLAWISSLSTVEKACLPAPLAPLHDVSDLMNYKDQGRGHRENVVSPPSFDLVEIKNEALATCGSFVVQLARLRIT